MIECRYCDKTFTAPSDDPLDSVKGRLFTHVQEDHSQLITEVVTGEISAKTFGMIQSQHVMTQARQLAAGGSHDD